MPDRVIYAILATQLRAIPLNKQMRFSQSLFDIPDHLIRYGYYAFCMVLMELYQLLAYSRLDLLSLLLPFGYLALLVLTGRIVCHFSQWEESTLESLAAAQRIHFFNELGVYALAAVSAFAASLTLLDVPMVEALGLFLIIITVGYFAGLGTTLSASRQWFRSGIEQNVETFRLTPTAVSLRRAVLSILALIFGFFIASVLKLYLGILQEESPPTQALVFQFTGEMLFYIVMIGALMFTAIRAYSRNLHFILEAQLKVLRDAQAGEFTHRIPILSQNELGLMSIQLNRLVDYVHSREKVENLLRRVVSPDIMDKLLNTDTETLKHGEEREVAILFCDIRGFTEMSEATSAEDIIMFLNSFFSELSEIVSRYNGIVNKFMGDAILAVFSTEHPAWAIDNAMVSAMDIAERVNQFRLPDGSPPSAGIGVHYGNVVAGTIGSDQRYEYTFLGDAVNTANRLEGLSKRLGMTIIVSSEAYQIMSDPLKLNLTDLGYHKVRGKSEPIHVYGGPVVPGE